MTTFNRNFIVNVLCFIFYDGYSYDLLQIAKQLGHHGLPSLSALLTKFHSKLPRVDHVLNAVVIRNLIQTEELFIAAFKIPRQVLIRPEQRN